MDLTASQAERTFRTEVRAFIESHLSSELRDRVLGFKRVDREDYVGWQHQLNARGWGAPSWPTEYGGTGWNPIQRNIFEEECLSAGAPRQIPMGQTMLAPVLLRFGTEQQKQHYLPRILTLQDWWCQGYSEPGSGSDLASLRTKAVRRGNVYVVSGQKIWTTYAHWANWIFCLVRTDSSGKQQAGISFLLIDMQSPGVTVQPIVTLDHGHDVNSVFLDNVEVPVDNLVGSEGGGWEMAKYLLSHERTGIAALGLCKRLVRLVKHHARREMKRGKPLLEDPRFRDRVVRLEMDLLAHEWTMLRLLAMDPSKQNGTEASILKIRGSEIQQQATELMMESAGPYALPYLSEALEAGWKGETAGGDEVNPLAAAYFDMRKSTIYGGTSEVQKTLISRQVLK